MIGVLLEKHITMEQHVTSVCRAARYHLYNIGKIRKFLSQPSTEQLVHAFITSKIDYCNALFCGLPSSLIGRMQGIQNVAARIITRSKASDYITPVIRQFHWLPIVQRIKCKVILRVFKCVSSRHHSSASAITNSAILLSTAARCSLHPPQLSEPLAWQAHACGTHYHHICAGSVTLIVLNRH